MGLARHFLPCFLVVSIKFERPVGPNGVDGSHRAAVLVVAVAVLDDVVQSGLQFGIVGEPLVELAFVEVTCREGDVFGHEVGQVLKGVRGLVFRGVVDDVEVGQNFVFLHGHVLPVDVGVNRLEVPSFLRAFDEQSPHDSVERVGDVGGDVDGAFHLAERVFLFGACEGFFAHPHREYGHAERIEVGLGSHLARYAPVVVHGGVVFLVDFGGGIDGGAVAPRHAIFAHDAVLGLGFQQVGNAKVAQHATPSFSVLDKDVGRLHVFVQHIGFVHLVETHGDAVGDEEDGLRLFLVLWVGGKVEVGVCRAFAFHKLHQFEGVAVGFNVDDAIFALQWLQGIQHLLVGSEPWVTKFQGVGFLAFLHFEYLAFGAVAKTFRDGAVVATHCNIFAHLVLKPRGCLALRFCRPTGGSRCLFGGSRCLFRNGCCLFGGDCCPFWRMGIRRHRFRCHSRAFGY